jgi:DNA-binding GntR family transcriptional regulator
MIRMIDELDDLYALLLVVESTAVRATIPTLAGDRAGRLSALADRMDHHASRRDWAGHGRAHRSFHALLVSGGGARAQGLALALADEAESHRLARLGGAAADERAGREHRRILASVLEQDLEACVGQVIDHRARTATEIAAAIDPGRPMEKMARAAAVARCRRPALDAAWR